MSPNWDQRHRSTVYPAKEAGFCWPNQLPSLYSLPIWLHPWLRQDCFGTSKADAGSSTLSRWSQALLHWPRVYSFCNPDVHLPRSSWCHFLPGHCLWFCFHRHMGRGLSEASFAAFPGPLSSRSISAVSCGLASLNAFCPYHFEGVVMEVLLQALLTARIDHQDHGRRKRLSSLWWTRSQELNHRPRFFRSWRRFWSLIFHLACCHLGQGGSFMGCWEVEEFQMSCWRTICCHCLAACGRRRETARLEPADLCLSSLHLRLRCLLTEGRLAPSPPSSLLQCCEVAHWTYWPNWCPSRSFLQIHYSGKYCWSSSVVLKVNQPLSFAIFHFGPTHSSTFAAQGYKMTDDWKQWRTL